MYRATRFFDENELVSEEEIWNAMQEAQKSFVSRKFAPLSEEYSVTENGAVGYKTTSHPLLDLNFKVSSYRARNEACITADFALAYEVNRMHSVKWLFFLRDIAEGLGERRTFRTCLKYLAEFEPKTASAVLRFIPEYGRYDDLLLFLDTPLRKEVSALLSAQLVKDVQAMQANKPISLLAKWLPSNNTSSEESRRLAKMLMKDFGMSPKLYRTTLSALRAYMDVTEVKMSAGQWSEIDYNKVPAKANLKYDDAFYRRDAERREQYLLDLLYGKAKMNHKGLVPHEIVHEMLHKASKEHSIRILNLLWKSMAAQGFENEWGLEDCIVVADGSGSMYTTVGGSSRLRAIEVCNALAIYFSEQLKGIFKDKAITFSMTPQFIDLSGAETLDQKLKIMFSHCECANTNIEAVFDLLLELAVDNHIPVEMLPKQVLILSDMEFDMASGCYWNSASEVKPLFAVIEEKYRRAGYEMPRLIFWNLCGRSDTIPMVKSDNGLCLLSGFSQNAAKVAADRRICDPYEALLKVLDGPRYKKIEEALAGVAC